MLLRSLEDCISDTTDEVVNYLSDSHFHREVMGLSDQQSRQLSNVRMSAIRDTVTSVFGATRTETYSDHEERLSAMAYRLRDSMRAFRATEGLPPALDQEADLNSCRESVASVFKPSYPRPQVI